jgi:predicted  nucleic acid-binding Zn-ribbon protein
MKRKTESDKPADVEEARAAAAENAWQEADDMEDVEVADSEGWLSATGDPQWERKFYYEDAEPEADCHVATFIVVFKDGSAEVKDSHVNW